MRLKTCIKISCVLCLCSQLVLNLTGCAGVALLYSHTTRPLDTDMNRTPVGPLTGRTSGITEVVEPFTGAQISLQLFTNAFGDIYQLNSIHSGNYADIEQKSVFLGVWQEHTVQVNGE